MADKGKRTIWVGPADGSAFAHPQTVEGKALGVVRPGALVAQAATGIDEAATASTVFGVLPLFANKDEMGTSLSVDTDWTSGENMVAIQGRSGDFLNVLVATSQTISKSGMGLASAGDGTLKLAATDGTDEILAYSDEIVTTTAAQLVRVVIK